MANISDNYSGNYSGNHSSSSSSSSNTVVVLIVLGLSMSRMLILGIVISNCSGYCLITIF